MQFRPVQNFRKKGLDGALYLHPWPLLPAAERKSWLEEIEIEDSATLIMIGTRGSRPSVMPRIRIAPLMEKAAL
jgi:hypothetical protein